MPGASFAREEIWGGLRALARPDSRFHFRFSEFIPDFEGSAAAMDRLCDLPGFAQARHVFVAPDNSLTELRRRLLVAGVNLVVSSYNMARGFYVLRPGSVPAGHERYAAWLDGLEHFGEPLTLQALSALGRFDFVVSGASAVATSGVRFGRGHGFFDLEWRIFSDMGLVGESTPLATVVHDVQVLERRLFPSPDDVLVDWICTPTRTLAVAREAARPRGVRWQDIAPEQIAAMPALAEWHRTVGLA
ncbi:MAG: 5-formyltetrahydrofolate cyclo-ligase [Rhodoferax sp.]|nr:5-formyltetrahydrofolate cyclo-ligase [Rhodoferax sp.]